MTKEYALNGRIINANTSTGAPDLRVEAWDKDNTYNDRLGEATTDSKGLFTITFRAEQFQDHPADDLPDLFFRIYQNGFQVYHTEDTPLQSWSGEEPVEITVPLPEFVVQGEVVKPDGTPLQQYRVRAYDRVLCDWRLLGETRSNDLGLYRIEYASSQFERWGKNRPDLKVQLYDPEKGTGLVASSPLILQALPFETVNFSVGDTAYRGPDAFTKLGRSLSTLLEPVEDLSCLGSADAHILARESGQDLVDTAYYLKAKRWEEDLELPAPFCFAWFRMGLPTQKSALFARSNLVLWNALKRAGEQNLHSLSLTEEARSRLLNVQERYLGREGHPFRDVLQTSGLEPERQAQFIRLLISGRHHGEDFWNALGEKGFSETEIEGLKQTFQLQTLTGDNTSLTLFLKNERGVREPKELGRYSREDWFALLAEDHIEIPDHILPGRDEASRRQGYALSLYRNFEKNYPTASVSGQLQRSADWSGSPVDILLQRDAGFEFEEQRLRNYLREHPDFLEDFDDPEATRKELLRFEAFYHLCPKEEKLEALTPLWNSRFESASQIAYAGRHVLARQLNGSLKPETVRAIHQNAVYRTSVALNVYLRFNPQLNFLSLHGLQGQGPAFPVSRSTDLPEWTELFGVADACSCDPCESVHGPAPYLVELMAFLMRAKDEDGLNGLDHLEKRRPDLFFLQLNCENAETSLPKIDLVNEILEQIIAFSTDGKTIPTDRVAQTTLDADSLAAQPEYLEPEAYKKLRTELYPFPLLPFNLWVEESRRYLRQMGLDRSALMEMFPPGSPDWDKAIATEVLGMTPLEAEILESTRLNTAELAAHWGVDLSRGSLRSQLTQVSVFMDKAGIDYEELLQLLNTRFLNPERTVAIDFQGDPCNLEAAVFSGDGWRVFFDRTHRFLRLHHRMESEIYELDQVVHALGIPDFNSPLAVQRLARVKELQESFGLDLGELSSWWADLDTFVYEPGQPSQYESVFLDPLLFPDIQTGTGPDLRNEVFALNPDRNELIVVSNPNPDQGHWLAETGTGGDVTYVLQEDYAAYIESATQLNREDLELLIGTVLPKDSTTGNVALNLSNISLLYRLKSYIKALKISLKDYLRLRKLIGADGVYLPDNPSGPLESWAFYQKTKGIQESAWSIEASVYLLLHEEEAAAVYSPHPEEVDQLSAELSSGMEGILDPALFEENDDLRNSILQSLAASLGLEAVLLEELLFSLRPDLGSDLLLHLITTANSDVTGLPTPGRSFYEFFETLHKFGLAWSSLELADSHLRYILLLSPLFNWTDPSAFPLQEQATTHFNHWLNLIRIADLQSAMFTEDNCVFRLFEDLRDNSLNQEELLALTAEWTGWNGNDLNYLTGPDGFQWTFPDDFKDPNWLQSLRLIFETVEPLGVSAAQVHGWASEDLEYAGAQSIRQALRKGYATESWQALIGPIQDELRTLKRDALQAALMKNFPGQDATDFYQHYLIDPETTPCFQTSRIVEAHASVQLLIQRILLNLEPTLSFSQEDARAWQWRKNYRVWEAGLKVLLYPENWLLPEWRDNKTSLFVELEEGLLQEEVNLDSAEHLYRNYLRGLDKIARPEIMAMYQEKEPDILHVFARTREIPKEYFYRRWEEKARWTPWERIDLDIESDHLVPIVYNNRLFLFWPNFRLQDNPPETAELDKELDELYQQKADLELAIDQLEDSVGGDIATPVLNASLDLLLEEIEDKEAERQGIIDRTPDYEIELRLAWSEYEKGRWSPKTIAQTPRTMTSDHDLEAHYLVGGVDEDNRLFIGVYGYKNTNGVIETDWFDTFIWNECNGKFVQGRSALVDNVEVPPGEITIEDADNYYNALKITNYDDNVLTIHSKEDDSTAEVLKNGASTSFTYHYAGQYGHQGSAASPFFYADDTRTFFVLPPNDPRQKISLETGLSFPVQSRLIAAEVNGGDVGLKQESTVSHHSGINNDIIYRALDEVASDGIQDRVDYVLQQDVEPDSALGLNGYMYPFDTQFRFHNFYHPFSCLFIKQESRFGIDGLLQPDEGAGGDSAELYRQMLSNTLDFESADLYDPTGLVSADYPQEVIDFDPDSAYGIYNWELFYHIPYLIAIRLMQNRKFAEAQQWFHYIFDPTHSNTSEPAPARFWNVKPFYELQLEGPTDTLQELIDLFEQGDPGFEKQVEEWEKDPFNPFRIARLRIMAFMKATVMAYVDNLLDWADFLFSQATREAVNEATQLYLLAQEILGPRPILLPKQEQTVWTPNLLLGRFSLVFEGIHDWLADGSLPFDPYPLDTISGYLPVQNAGPEVPRNSSFGRLAITAPAQGGESNFQTLFHFCIPQNEKLLGYWDTVADRLYKIRHCQDIEGQALDLALFAPPIDPALLIQAGAAGLDIGTVISSLYAPLPHYRFRYLIRQALDFCSTVKSLGQSLLSALASTDGEELTLLRATQELQLLNSVREIKKKSIEEAETNRQHLEKAMDLAVNRKEFFEQREFMNTGETLGIELIGTGSALQIASQLLEKSALPFYPVPKTIAGGAGISSPVLLTIATDWEQMSAPVKTGSRMLSMLASIASTAASVSQTMAGFQRRQEDWDFQADQAKREIEQIDKQILAADIRKQIAEKDLEYHEEQISRAADVEDFLKLKFTNKDLYNWNISQINKIYFPAYQLAYQLAKYAEKALQYELGLDAADSKYIQANYWDSLKKGLMAGELLEHDLRRMEMAHIEQHAREYELTRHISLRRLNPYALLELKVNGQCTIDIPEYLFDLDAPGHYMRRIRQLSVSLPAVAGPFTGVHCTLTLNKSSVRKSALLTGPNNDGYARETEDSRFEEYYSAIPSIVTSSGQNDSGLFEANLQDERYLPFEGAGVIGNWTLKLPAEFRQFDYNTINDVIFHVRYTAREGGEALAAAASAHTSTILSDASKAEQAQLFSLRHDFPNEWHKMIQDPGSNLSIVIKRDHFPYLIQGRTVGIAGKELQVIRIETLVDESPAILSDTLADLNTEGEGEVVLDGAVLQDAEEAFLILRYTVT